ncbi:hypothetical protein L2E82_25485 [Cichorium intybus]|uniref:Uncharacterized protein n=1 Tax=Cichorium intybus TaxID=13427 RepID=A0ACB9E470_CICIN|nr:hypothetical protein L2E82_25485 [Cichorium intybus]
MSEWPEVKRHRPAHSGDDSLTSFFVTNLPRDASRSELWKLCAKLGHLKDIYITRRRDDGGLFFAFVKFSGVTDSEEIVRGLNLIRIRGRLFHANISLHPRKPPPAIPHRRTDPPPKSYHIPVSNPKDSRSFADALKGLHPPKAPLKLALKVISQNLEWLENAAFIGEVRNFDLLYNFLSIFEMEGYDVLEIKYLGSMLIAIKFRSSRAADDVEFIPPSTDGAADRNAPVISSDSVVGETLHGETSEAKQSLGVTLEDDTEVTTSHIPHVGVDPLTGSNPVPIISSQQPTEPINLGPTGSPHNNNGVSSPEFEPGNSALKRRRLKDKKGVHPNRVPIHNAPRINPIAQGNGAFGAALFVDGVQIGPK